MITSTRVLVVDDSAATAVVVAKLVNQCGFPDIDCVPSGEHALSMLNNNSYGLIIADVNMPGMSGVELLARVRNDESYCKILFILMTAMRDRETVDAAVRYQADGLILKPFTASSLRTKLGMIPRLQLA